MNDELKPSGSAALMKSEGLAAELNRIRDMLVNNRGATEMLQRKSEMAGALELSQRIVGLTMPERAIAGIVQQKHDRLAAIERVGATLQSPSMGSVLLQHGVIGRMLQDQQNLFAAMRRTADSLTHHLQKFQGISESLRPAASVMGEAFAAQQRRAESMRRLVEDMPSPFESVRERLLPNHRLIGDAIGRWSVSAVADLVAEYGADDTLTANGVQSDVDSHLVEISVALEQLSAGQASGNSGLTWEQWLSIVGFVLTILTTWYQLHDSERMETRLTDAISTSTDHLETHNEATNAKLDRLVASLERLAPHPPGDQYMVAVPTLRLRASPEGREIARVHANQVVTATGQRGQWLRVRYFDYRDSRLIEGWCWKKHLERVEKVVRPSFNSERS